MKKYLFILFLLFVPVSGLVSKGCSDPYLMRLVQDVLNNTNIIKPNVKNIQEIVIEIYGALTQCCEELNSRLDHLDVSISNEDVLSKLDEIDEDLSACCEGINSRLDNLSFSVSNEDVLSKLDVVDDNLSECCEGINSRLDNLSFSVSNEDVLSKLDELDEDLSACCEGINSRLDNLDLSIIGDLDDSGSCLDSVIDVPDDINNLNLNVIELLKTILLELRGC